VGEWCCSCGWFGVLCSTVMVLFVCFFFSSMFYFYSLGGFLLVLWCVLVVRFCCVVPFFGLFSFCVWVGVVLFFLVGVDLWLSVVYFFGPVFVCLFWYGFGCVLLYFLSPCLSLFFSSVVVFLVVWGVAFSCLGFCVLLLLGFLWASFFSSLSYCFGGFF